MNRTNKTTVPNLSGPIIAGNCISCMGMVRISSTMSVNATVRCPHCQEAFVLSDLLDQSLPPLEVVVTEQSDALQEDAPYIDTLHLKRDEQESRPEKPRVKFDIPKALRDGAKKKRRRRRSKSSSSRSGSRSSRSENASSNFVIPSESSNAGTSVDNDLTTMGEAVERRRSSSNGSSGSRRSSSRSSDSGSGSSENRAAYRGKVKTYASRMKEANGEFNVQAIFRVLFGCMLAFAMAYLMLIWIFKSDPLRVAPSISKAVPFAIPSSMQSGKESDAEVAEEKSKRDLPSYLTDDEKVLPFEPETFSEDSDRIAVPNIDPDEVFGQEFGL